MAVRKTTAVFGMAVLLSGCAGISREAKRILREPVRCDAPQADIAELQRARSGGGLRFLQLMQAILPPAALVSIIRGLLGKPPEMYTDHWRVGTGRTNDEIEARIVEIRRTCAG